MAQFSIKEAVKFSFVAYGKHCVLLLSASALVGTSLWLATVAPRYVSQKLDIEHYLIRQDINAAGISYDEAKADPSLITQCGAEGIVGRISARPVESAALILVIVLVCGLFFILMLGCMKLGLSLIDKNSGSLRLMFQISVRQIMKFVGASFVLMLNLLILAATLGTLPTLCGILCAPFFGPSLAHIIYFVLSVCVVAAVFVWVLRSFFYGYCIVDKPTIGMFEAFGMSREITHGSMCRLITLLFIFAVLVLVVRYIIDASILLSGSVEVMKHGIDCARFVCILVIMPFFISCFSYIYRSITRKAYSKLISSEYTFVKK